MSYDPTNHERLDELLSAYLDGELTADEQALVEQRLAESAEFRQLHDELRALRTSLENLPRYKLNEDLGPAVLRRAERAMLSAPSATQLASAASDDKVSLADRSSPRHRPSSVRLLRWSVVAIAVAVLVMIFNPRMSRHAREVAQRRSTEDAASRAAGAKPKEAVDEALNSSADHYFDEGESDDSVGRTKALPAAAPLAEETMELEENVARSDESSRFARHGKLSGRKDGFDVSGGEKRGATVESSPGDAEDSQRFDTQPRRNAHPAQRPTMSDGRREARPQFHSSRSSTTRAGGMGGGGMGGGDGGGGGGFASNGVLVVQCDISAAAAQSQAFEQLLAEQHIELVNDTDNTAQKSKLEVLDLESSEAKKPAVSKSEDAPAIKIQSDRGAIRTQDEADRPGRQSKPKKESVSDELELKRDAGAPVPQVNAFFVEAPPEQIQATLAALQTRKNQFLAVTFSEPKSVQLDAKLHELKDLEKAAEATQESEAAGDANEFAVPQTNQPAAKGMTEDASAFSKDAARDKQTLQSRSKSDKSSPRVRSLPALPQATISLGKGTSQTRALGNAQRVVVDLAQFDDAVRQFVPLERLKEDADGDDGMTRDVNDHLQKQLGKFNYNQSGASSAPGAPAHNKPTDVPAGPANLAKSRKAASGLDFGGLSEPPTKAPQSGTQVAAAAPQPSPISVLFLFRVVPSSEP